MKVPGITLTVFGLVSIENAPPRNAFTVHSLKNQAGDEIDDQTTQNPRGTAGDDWKRQIQQMVAGVLAATAISFAAATTPLPSSQSSFSIANAAELQISKGSIVIELTAPTTATSDSSGQTAISLKKFDTTQEKKLLQSLLKNRKELGKSIGRIQKSIQNEFEQGSATGPTAAPIWTEIYQELLSIEGDVLPKVQIRPPVDPKATFQDLRMGKLNLLVNGEIINISAEPTYGKDEDDLIIRIKGFKGGMVSRDTIKEKLPPSYYYGPIRTWLSQYQQFWSFWDTPTNLLSTGESAPAFISSITNGEVFVGGAVSAVVLSYVASYSYHIQLQKADEAAAKAKQKKAAEAKKKKAEAAKMKKEEDAAAKKKVEEATKKKEEESKTTKNKAEEEKAKKEEAEEAEATKEGESQEANKAGKENSKDSKTTENETAETTEDQSSSTITTSEQTKPKRHHRFRFWKNNKK